MKMWNVAGRPILSEMAAQARRPPRFPTLSMRMKEEAKAAVTMVGSVPLNTSDISGFADPNRANPPDQGFR